ncbi:3-oxoacyl-ACP synthase [Streptomyces sp. HU2014]|uniref:3-oxoacyl-ACP synthase n=1 Tax=Streptomyces albireticuli TaxID=1940 RepID=A0A1Z2LBV2_9ACTN|nr:MULTISPECIES: 3-oxoacyl-[acyl-carrier-protein] synthase III C-terminal domain-containing protein [Streptomyces]ARZ71765.1 3-oxoacyl-ACP synthase [Streptomyces albireticuli]UQI45195.1 3-oxoacyl-ACP synthase [Streptomyces sp. HU2014]
MSDTRRARLAAAAVHLPPRYRTMAAIRERIAASGGAYVPPVGLLEDLTGVRGVHVRDEGVQASDLAVAAAAKALEAAGAGTDDVDLLLFAATSHDLLEPATAHIVAAKLGLVCPVFDIKNACNSVLNAVETACAFIAVGRYRTVLIACGETLTETTRWRLPDHEALLRAMPGYTVSDAGAALVLTAGPAGERDPGVLSLAFGGDSTAWEACTLAGGGSLHGRSTDDEHTTVRLNGSLLHDAFDVLPLALEVFAHREMEAVRASAFIAFHQISMPQFLDTSAKLCLPADRCLATVAEHGNCGAASLPLQLVAAQESERVEPGDLVGLIGLASGACFGVVQVRL